MEIFREVAGDGALFCSAESPEEFAAAIASLESPTIREELTAKGAAHTAQFNWASSARSIWKIAKKLTV